MVGLVVSSSPVSQQHTRRLKLIMITTLTECNIQVTLLLYIVRITVVCVQKPQVTCKVVDRGTLQYACVHDKT